MSLNPSFTCSAASAAAAAGTPSAKLTININAFNGNTTNFNRKSFTPVQPSRDIPFARPATVRPGMIAPL